MGKSVTVHTVYIVHICDGKRGKQMPHSIFVIEKETTSQHTPKLQQQQKHIFVWEKENCRKPDRERYQQNYKLPCAASAI